MPFYLSYTLLSGAGTRFAATAADALIMHAELKSIAAGAITIRDENGNAVSIEQLTLFSPRPKMKREREGDSGA